ncbi:MAG: hypothetical protein NWE93_10775 [Candidatus Bathyarchaeota archaeon]|nr:hypothetical protein [Candidatus Bathyarchaeota archaeon]
MMKPYRFTKKGQYVGLPLAFGLLAASHVFSAVIYTEPSFLQKDTFLWIQLVARTFAFVFLAATYHFSREQSKQSETNQLIWNITFSVILVAIIASVISAIFLPQLNFANYRVASQYVRIFIIISLSYIIVMALKNQVANPQPANVLTPIGYMFFAISQFLIIIWAADSSMLAWWGSQLIRGGGIAIFLFVAYITFYRSPKKDTD